MSNVVTARVSDETLSLIDRVARLQGRSRARLIAQAVERFAEQEAAFLAFLDEGEEAIARGDYLTQEQMEQWFAARSASGPAE